MIDTVVMYGELIAFGLVSYLRQVYQPWMVLSVIGVLVLIMVLVAYSVLMWFFNERLRWYHKALYWLPVVKHIGTTQFRKGHKIGSVWGLKEGYKLAGNPKKLKQRKIVRALERAGI